MYRQIVIQTYKNTGEPSSALVRARALAGQGIPSGVNVECSKDMRRAHPIGTCFRIQAKVTDREGAVFVYTHHAWPYHVMSLEEATAFIKQNS